MEQENSQPIELPQEPGPLEEKKCFSLFKKSFELQSGIAVSHCIAYFICVMITIAAFVFMDNSQADVIELGMHHSHDKGKVQGSLIFADELLAICLLPIWGFVSDFIGRRALYACGFVFLSLGTFLYPFATTPFPMNFKTFFSSLLFFRFIFAVGSSIAGSLMAALLSDISSKSCTGRFSGFVGFFCGLGAIIGSVLIPAISNWVSKEGKSGPLKITTVHTSYYIMSGILLMTSILAFLFIFPGPSPDSPDDTKAVKEEEKSSYFKEDHSDLEREKPFIDDQEHPCRTRTRLLKRNIRLSIMSLSNIMILLAYFSSFVARTVTLIYQSFYTQWFGAANYKRSMSIRGTLNLTTLISSPFYGFFANKVSGVVSISMACFFCIVAHSIMLIVNDKSSQLQYVVAILAGAGQAGFAISGLALVSHYAPKNIRGAVSGAYGFCGGLGVLVNSELAGHLFDKWDYSPFVILMAWSSILLALAIVFSIIMRSRRPCQYRM